MDLSPIEELMIRRLGKTCKLGVSRCIDRRLFKRLKKDLTMEVNDLLIRQGLTYPPFDPFRIQKIGNAKIEVIYVSRAEIGADGCLEACDDGFLVKIDKALVRVRQRSTMAHELAHTFFYDVMRMPPTKMAGRAKSRKHFMMEEELCFCLAREFLIPKFSILDLLSKRKSLRSPSVTNVEFLKSTYVASSDIVAYRMVSDLHLWNCVFVKSLKDGAVFKFKTRLKNKGSRFYRKIKIPPYIPFGSSKMWHRFLQHILKTVASGRFEEILDLKGENLVLESSVESRNPISVMTLIYKSCVRANLGTYM